MPENQFLETQANQASQNPNIVSPLTTPTTSSPTMTGPAPSAAPSTAPVGASASMPTGGVTAPAYYQDASNMAQELSGKLYGSGFVSGGEQQNENLLQQLFQYDQALEGQYSPFPQVPGYVENPADLYGAGAQFAAGVGRVSGAQGSAISDAESAYNAAISGLLDKFISFAQMKEDREEREKERQAQEKKDRLDFELSIAKLTGGTVTNPYTGEKINVPKDMGNLSFGERQMNQMTDQLQKDIAGGLTPRDLFAKYQGALDFNTIVTAYNNASPYGPAHESMDELRSMYERTGGVGPEDPTVKSYADRVQSGEYTITNVPVEGGMRNAVVTALGNRPLSNEERQNIDGITKNIDDYQKLLNRRFAGIIPLTADKGKATVSHGLLTMAIARLFEKGRMSDQDRAFYSELVPTAELAAASPEQARAQLEQVRQFINQKFNEGEAEMIRVKEKSSGRTGSIPANEFNEGLYERI